MTDRNLNSEFKNTLNAKLYATVGRGVRSARISDGELIFTMTDGNEINLGAITGRETLPIATKNLLGGIKAGNGLIIAEDGLLSVDTAERVEKDNTKPITSGAVHMEMGNIEVLLKKI
ncbi:hypothetical protein IMSAG049_00419 [Clostridiales bacterium]|nr:hypothetical protein IMSAG049_00419 [Clostridiales bacterium]